MQGTKWWLVCYDIHDPKRLRETAKHMEGYGERIQWSVFRCWMTKLQMERLRWELTELLDPIDDVLLIPLCSSCVASIQTTHNKDEPLWPPEPPRYDIV